MTEKDYAVYRYLEKVAEQEPTRWVSKEELIAQFPTYFKANEESHDICSTINLVRLNINKARAKGQVSHLVLLSGHCFKLATSKEEADEFINKDYRNGIKLLVRYYQNRGAIKEDGQGKLIDCRGNPITEESLAKRFNDAFVFETKTKSKVALSEIISNDKAVIHTPTYEQAKKLLCELDKRGLMWGSDIDYLQQINWDIYKADTCYRPSRGQYDHISFGKYAGYEVFEFEDVDLGA